MRSGVRCFLLALAAVTPLRVAGEEDPVQRCFADPPGVVNRSHIPLKISRLGWLTHDIVSDIALIVLREFLGYTNTTNIARVNDHLWGEDMSSGISDMDLESWQATLGNSEYTKFITESRDVHDLGPIGYPGRSGLYTFKSVLEHAILADYYKFYQNASEAMQVGFQSFNSSQLRAFLGDSFPHCTAEADWCGSGELAGYWAPPECEEDPHSCLTVFHSTPNYDAGYFEQLTKHTGVHAVFGYFGYAMPDFIEQQYSIGRPLMFYWWEPDVLVLKVDAVRISFPDHFYGCDSSHAHHPDDGNVACDYAETVLRKLVSNRVLERSPEAYYFLSRLEVAEDEIKSIISSTQAGGGTLTANAAACEWVRRNEWRIRLYAPSCITNPIAELPRGEEEVFNPQTLECENRTALIREYPTECFIDPALKPGTVDRSGQELLLVMRDWMTHDLISIVTEVLLRDFLGYKVTVVRNNRTSSFLWGPEMAAGLYDIDMENWAVTWGTSSYIDYVQSGMVTIAGLTGFSGRSGVFAPLQLVENNRMADYHKFYRNATVAAAAGATLHQDSPLREVLGDAFPLCSHVNYYWCGLGELEGYWATDTCRSNPGRCVEFILWGPGYEESRVEQLLQNNDMEVVVAYYGASLWSALEENLRVGRLTPFYWWEPDVNMFRVPSRRIAFPDYSLGCSRGNTKDPETGSVDCDFPEATLSKIVRNRVKESYREAFYVLQRIEFNSSVINQLMQNHTQAGGTQTTVELACGFIHSNLALLNEWAPPCIVSPPPPQLVRVNDTVFSQEDRMCVSKVCDLDEILRFERETQEFSCRPCLRQNEVPDEEQHLCKLCGPGEEVNPHGTACVDCAPGTYSLGLTGSCAACDEGFYAASAGMSSCEECPAGKHQSARGQELCLDCDSGTAAAEPASFQCLACDPGVFASNKGQSACQACEVGRFQEFQRGTECIHCPSGTFANRPGARDCSPCSPGFFKANASAPHTCAPCPLGKYASEFARTACEECMIGMTTNLLGADRPDFCLCPSNHFQYRSQDGNRSQCMPCNEYMESCEGGLAPAYQRAGYYITPDGQKVYRCASEDACPLALLGQCPEGSYGRGCAECDGEYTWDGEQCTKCGVEDIFLVCALPLALVVLLVITYKYGNDPIGRKLSALSEFIVVVGLSLNIFLYLNSFSGFDVEWKEPVKTLMTISLKVAHEVSSIHISCSVSFGYTTNYMITSLVPLVIALVCFAIGAVYVPSRRRLANTLGTCVYALFLLLVLHALKPFRYIVHPTGGKSVLDLPAVFEGSDEHVGLVLVGIAVMLLYCIPFATACIWAAAKVAVVKHQVQRRWYLLTFRFLFYKFSPQAYYWGVIILIRNTIFALAPSLAPDAPKVGVFMMALVASCSSAHTARVSPWRATWMNAVDVGILCYMVLILVLATGWVRQSRDADAFFATFLFSIAAVAATVGLIFIARLVFRIAFASKEKLERLKARAQKEDERYAIEMMEAFPDPDMEYAHALDTLPHRNQQVESRSRTKGDNALPRPLLRVSKETSDLTLIYAIARSIRDRDYLLESFLDDCTKAFPELQLYDAVLSADETGSMTASGTHSRSMRSSSRSTTSSNSTAGGFSLAEEGLRTMGAFVAIYALCRLDMDGKDIFSFGTDERGKATNFAERLDPSELKDLAQTPWGKMTPAQRRANFRMNFDWQLFEKLFLDSGVLLFREDGKRLRTDSQAEGRLVALLCLTAFHDIMKDQALCPVVHDDEYEGFKPGEVIMDHDLALAYVLDRYPQTLPSFRVLTREQRALIRFTQSEMGFNAGWLVQAEGPPSAVLSKLKAAVASGGASERDVAFYFVHWVTDLAGAEPTPFTGSEKFAAKFPPPVLQGLLGCCSYVKMLGTHTETEVYEAYLTQRWEAFSAQTGLSQTVLPPSPDRIARMRLLCMAQGGAAQMLQAFDRLDEADRDTLSRELASTGLRGQEFSDWKAVSGPGAGTPFLLYYGPAWCQRAGAIAPDFALHVLASIFRLSRRAYTESTDVTADGEAGITSRTIQVGELKSIGLEAFISCGDDVADMMVVKRDTRLEGTLTINVHDI